MASIANITVNMNLRGRSAVYTPIVNRPKLGLEKGIAYAADVLGIYQVADGEDVNAYFVIVLPDGKCAYAGIEQIRFTDCGESAAEEDDEDE